MDDASLKELQNDIRHMDEAELLASEVVGQFENFSSVWHPVINHDSQGISQKSYPH